MQVRFSFGTLVFFTVLFTFIPLPNETSIPGGYFNQYFQQKLKYFNEKVSCNSFLSGS